MIAVCTTIVCQFCGSQQQFSATANRFTLCGPTIRRLCTGKLPKGLRTNRALCRPRLEGLGYEHRIGSNTATRSELVPEARHYYYAPGTKTAIMAGDTQKAYAVWVWRPLPESCQLAPLSIGTERHITSEDDEKTYVGKLESENKMSARMVIERDGTSVVRDAAGNVYIASGQVYVYDKNGAPNRGARGTGAPQQPGIGRRGDANLTYWCAFIAPCD